MKAKPVLILSLSIILFLSILGTALYFGVIKQSGVSSSDFVKPQWARLECSPLNPAGYDGKLYKWLDEGQTLFKCDQNTDQCRFRIQDSPSGSCYNPLNSVKGKYQICDVNGNNCGSSIQYSICGGNPTDYIFINNGQSVKFATGIFVTGESKTKIEFEWKPYVLNRFVGGARFVVNSVDCSITTSTRANILSGDNVDKLSRTGGPGLSWINYVNDWVYGPATNIVTYNSQQAYCSAGQVHSIVKLQVADGSLKKVDPMYKGTKPDGTAVNGLGNIIANVECCPSEPSCGSDFKYVKVVTNEKSCVSDIQCFNAGNPVSETGTTYVKYQCLSGNCIKSSPITVQCTTNAQCNNGQICDLSTTNYGSCVTQISGEYCGDGICQSTENGNTCSIDCGSSQKECSSFGQTYKESDSSLFGLIPASRGCVTSGWVYLAVFLIFITILILAVVIYFKLFT